MPTAAKTRPWHARHPGPYATGSTLSPMSLFLHASRWPLYHLAGNRAKTPGALGYAASEVCAPHPHAELELCSVSAAISGSVLLVHP